MKIVALLSAGAAVVASVAAVAVAKDAAEVQPPPPASSTVVPVSQVDLTCPGGIGQVTDSTSALVVAPKLEGTDTARGPRPATVTSIDGATSVDEVSTRGVPVVADASDPLAVSAHGALAAGIAAGQWSVPDAKADDPGAAATTCGPPSDAWWFNAVNTAVGATSRLVLSNPTPAITVVNLAFFAADGRVETVGAQGIALAPESLRSIDLSRFAPGVEALTIEASASQGRFVAAVSTSMRAGAEPAGVEWVAPSRAPGTDVVVGPTLGGKASQQLVIANPGDAEALVKVQLIDSSGPFVPVGFDAIRIQPGAVYSKDVSTITDKESFAAHLTSTVPVTGGVVSTKAGKIHDLAIASATPGLTDPAMAPVVPDSEVSLAFATGVGSLTRVVVGAYDEDGDEVSSDTVVVKGSTATTWDLPAKSDAAYLVVGFDPTLPPADAASADLHVVALYKTDDGVAALPLVSGVTTVTRPAVTPYPPTP